MRGEVAIVEADADFGERRAVNVRFARTWRRTSSSCSRERIPLNDGSVAERPAGNVNVAISRTNGVRRERRCVQRG